MTGQRPPRVAFVLSSGRNLGAVQVGMLRALLERGIQPDLILGCSVGAINGAALAREPTLAQVENLEQLWRGLDGNELLPRLRAIPTAVGLARNAEAIHAIDGLRRFLMANLGAATFEELQVPFHCVATDVVGACEAWFAQGPLVEPLLASAAVPGLFPSVEVGGRRYVDGGVVNDIPARRAVDLGARVVYVLDAGTFLQPWSEPRRPTAAVREAYGIARRHRFRRELEALPGHVELHLLPHGDPPRLRLHDFGRSAELIERAHAASAVYLDRESRATASPPRWGDGTSVGAGCSPEMLAERAGNATAIPLGRS